MSFGSVDTVKFSKIPATIHNHHWLDRSRITAIADFKYWDCRHCYFVSAPPVHTAPAGRVSSGARWAAPPGNHALARSVPLKQSRVFKVFSQSRWSPTVAHSKQRFPITCKLRRVRLDCFHPPCLSQTNLRLIDQKTSQN